jgi:hypothetical protein
MSFPSDAGVSSSALAAWTPATKKKRSLLAVTAGVLGILALAFLFATPITFFFVMLLGEVLGELVAYVLLGAHILAITGAGCAAVGLGCLALVQLWRRKGELAGHGWAISALCTGPLPVLAGCAAVLLVGLELGAAEYFMSTVQAVASDDNSSNASLTELKSEIEKLRREVREGGNIYPTASPSNYGNGSQAMPPVYAPDDSAPCANWTRSSSPAPACCAPTCAAPFAAQPARAGGQLEPPSCAPACATPFAAQALPQPSIQPAAHVTPPAAAQPPVERSLRNLAPPEYVPPANSPRAELLPQPALQSAPAPRPDAPAEPAEMPESAPVISR